MNSKFKTLTLIALTLVFTVLCLIPAPQYAAEMPGLMVTGQYGDSCRCPMWPIYNCGCRIINVG